MIKKEVIHNLLKCVSLQVNECKIFLSNSNNSEHYKDLRLQSSNKMYNESILIRKNYIVLRFNCLQKIILLILYFLSLYLYYTR